VTHTSIIGLTPTYFYLSVDYTDGLKDQAARESYKGLNVRVEYNGGERTAPGPRPEQKVAFASGEFSQDYNEAMEFIVALNRNEAPVMASSSVDDYMVDAGYDTEENAADEAALEAWKDEPEDLPFLPLERGREVAVIDQKLAAAWDTIPAAKLRWALANVIATDRYNTSYPHSPLGRDEALQALDRLSILLGGLA
jgi:hypothetical protein